MVVFPGHYVCSLHATVELRKNSIYCVFLRKKRMYKSRPEITEVGLVKVMFVFMTG